MNTEANKELACRRCGNCCHLDVAAYVTLEDIQRWEHEGRDDILAHVRDLGVKWSDKAVVNRFIGTKTATCRMSCVYLTWNGPTASCGIYETRTRVCRSYMPGSSELCPQHNRKPASRQYNLPSEE